MWIMCSFGILMPAIRPAKTVKIGDERTLQIRARRAKDLDILRARYMRTSLGPTLHSPDKDYEYRAYCTPAAFALAMADMVREIDYTKFKPTTLDQYQDHDLHLTYNAIWSVVMNRLSTTLHRWEYWHGGTSTSARYELPSTLGGVSPALSEADRLDSWLARNSRSTAYDRDDYQPDLSELDPDEIDEYFDSAAALFDDSDGRIDHSKCLHAKTNNARARCRRRRIKEARQHRKSVTGEIVQ